MLIIGMVIGFLVAMIFLSCSTAFSEDDAYMEGFNEGLKVGEERGNRTEEGS